MDMSCLEEYFSSLSQFGEIDHGDILFRIKQLVVKVFSWVVEFHGVEGDR